LYLTIIFKLRRARVLVERQSDGVWIQKIRELVDDACEQFEELQENVKSVKLKFKMPKPCESPFGLAFVDGGQNFVVLTGGSIYFVRAAGAYFKSPDKPNWVSQVDTGFTSLTRNVDKFVAIERDILEIQTAIELLENKPEIVVLDNSLSSYAGISVPHSLIYRFRDPRPDTSPEFQYFARFVTFMKRFDLLIKECLSSKILLVGAAKDSRSRGYAKELGLGENVMDVTAVSLLANGQTGFTPIHDSKYNRIGRIEDYFEKHKILREDRDKIMTSFCILTPNANPFKIDFLRLQKDRFEEIQSRIVSLHDGAGYLLPSHIVHNHAAIPSELSGGLERLVLKKTAEQNMKTAEHILGAQRRSRFG